MNRHSNNTNALLVQIMLAVLFFSLCAVTLLQAYSAIHTRGERSGQAITVMTEARDTLEQLNSSDDPEALLAGAGFIRNDEAWLLQSGEHSIAVTVLNEQAAGGHLYSYTLNAADARGDILFTLHGAHYCLEVSR